MMKLGIIGYGKIGARHHQVFDALGAKIIASCNRSEAGRNRAKEAGIEKTYGSYQDMLEKERLDGIICSTSLFNNYEVAKELIPYGIPMLLEKPPGTSIEELDALIVLQEEYNTSVMLATNRIWYSVLYEAIRDIGGRDKIQGVHVMWSENPKQLKEKRGFTDKQVKTRNFSNSIHGLSILQFLCGTLAEFASVGHRGKGQFDWNMNLQGISDRGTIGQFTSSWSTILPWRLTFYGNQNIYDFTPLEQCVCTNLNTREKYEIKGADFDKAFKPGFYMQAKHFLESLGTGKMIPEVNLQNARVLFNYADELTNIFEDEADCSIR
jgi:predicted dehydrogenase